MAVETSKQSDTNLRIDVGVIKSQMTDMKVVVSRIEQKIDNNAYVHQATYEKDRESDDRKYATKEELRPVLRLFWGIITTIILGLLGFALTFAVGGGLKP